MSCRKRLLNLLVILIFLISSVSTGLAQSISTPSIDPSFSYVGPQFDEDYLKENQYQEKSFRSQDIPEEMNPKLVVLGMVLGSWFSSCKGEYVKDEKGYYRCSVPTNEDKLMSYCGTKEGIEKGTQEILEGLKERGGLENLFNQFLEQSREANWFKQAETQCSLPPAKACENFQELHGGKKIECPASKEQILENCLAEMKDLKDNRLIYLEQQCNQDSERQKYNFDYQCGEEFKRNKDQNRFEIPCPEPPKKPANLKAAVPISDDRGCIIGWTEEDFEHRTCSKQPSHSLQEECSKKNGWVKQEWQQTSPYCLVEEKCITQGELFKRKDVKCDRDQGENEFNSPEDCKPKTACGDNEWFDYHSGQCIKIEQPKPAVCGDKICETYKGESPTSCPADCGGQNGCNSINPGYCKTESECLTAGNQWFPKSDPNGGCITKCSTQNPGNCKDAAACSSIGGTWNSTGYYCEYNTYPRVCTSGSTSNCTMENCSQGGGSWCSNWPVPGCDFNPNTASRCQVMCSGTGQVKCFDSNGKEYCYLGTSCPGTGGTCSSTNRSACTSQTTCEGQGTGTWCPALSNGSQAQCITPGTSCPTIGGTCEQGKEEYTYNNIKKCVVVCPSGYYHSGPDGTCTSSGSGTCSSSYPTACTSTSCPTTGGAWCTNASPQTCAFLPSTCPTTSTGICSSSNASTCTTTTCAPSGGVWCNNGCLFGVTSCPSSGETNPICGNNACETNENQGQTSPCELDCGTVTCPNEITKHWTGYICPTTACSPSGGTCTTATSCGSAGGFWCTDSSHSWCNSTTCPTTGTTAGKELLGVASLQSTDDDSRGGDYYRYGYNYYPSGSSTAYPGYYPREGLRPSTEAYEYKSFESEMFCSNGKFDSTKFLNHCLTEGKNRIEKEQGFEKEMRKKLCEERIESELINVENYCRNNLNCESQVARGCNLHNKMKEALKELIEDEKNGFPLLTKLINEEYRRRCEFRPGGKLYNVLQEDESIKEISNRDLGNPTLNLAAQQQTAEIAELKAQINELNSQLDEQKKQLNVLTGFLQTLFGNKSSVEIGTKLSSRLEELDNEIDKYTKLANEATNNEEKQKALNAVANFEKEKTSLKQIAEASKNNIGILGAILGVLTGKATLVPMPFN